LADLVKVSTPHTGTASNAGQVVESTTLCVPINYHFYQYGTTTELSDYFRVTGTPGDHKFEVSNFPARSVSVSFEAEFWFTDFMNPNTFSH
jgi:hypothetical protein